MEYPILNLNGTSRSSLVEQYQNALEAVQNTLDVLSETSPHGRDYILNKDPRALINATNEYAERQNKLRIVRSELESIVINLCEQKGGHLNQYDIEFVL